MANFPQQQTFKEEMAGFKQENLGPQSSGNHDVSYLAEQLEHIVLSEQDTKFNHMRGAIPKPRGPKSESVNYNHPNPFMMNMDKLQYVADGGGSPTPRDLAGYGRQNRGGRGGRAAYGRRGGLGGEFSNNFEDDYNPRIAREARGAFCDRRGAAEFYSCGGTGGHIDSYDRGFGGGRRGGRRGGHSGGRGGREHGFSGGRGGGRGVRGRGGRGRGFSGGRGGGRSDQDLVERHKNNPRFCPVCKIFASSPEHMDMHLAGAPHLKKLKQFGLNSNVPLKEAASAINDQDGGGKYDRYRSLNGAYYCRKCRVKLNHISALQNHLRGKKHQGLQ